MRWQGGLTLVGHAVVLGCVRGLCVAIFRLVASLPRLYPEIKGAATLFDRVDFQDYVTCQGLNANCEVGNTCVPTFDKEENLN